MRLLELVLVAVLALAGAARAQDGGGISVTDLRLANGATQRVLYLAPERPPLAAVVLLTGGDGVLGIKDDGRLTRGGNFLIRTRERWRSERFAVAIPDVPSNHSDLLGTRHSAEYAEALRAVVRHIRDRTPAPIWLVGTSQGSNAAANGGARLGSEIAGVVLTSSVTRQSQRGHAETVFDADLGAIAVPVLVVSHGGDTCQVTPPADAERIRRAVKRSPRAEVMLFDGGDPPRSDPCEAFSAHGFLGIEGQVIGRIGAWIKS